MSPRFMAGVARTSCARRCSSSRELVEAEVPGQVGAGLSEAAPETGSTYRNGYRPGPWETGVGEIELMIPRMRAMSPSSLEPPAPV